MGNSRAADYDSLVRRELQLRAAAGRVMQDLKAEGGDWQLAWRDHPVAIAYRALLREAWAEATSARVSKG
jgi:hypothetical protein